jgi:hypothetical protein
MTSQDTAVTKGLGPACFLGLLRFVAFGSTPALDLASRRGKENPTHRGTF